MKITATQGRQFGIAAAVATIVLASAGTASALQFEVGDTTLDIYGYAKLDLIHDFDSNRGGVFFVRDLPVGADEDNQVEGTTQFQAVESRLGFATSTPTNNGGPFQTRIEGDFFAATGSGADVLRLRHAYGEWNGWLAGQTWSNFMPLIGLPPVIDFGGPAGYIFNRQGQIRYTWDANNGQHFAVAVEQGSSSVEDAQDNFPGASSNTPLPDLTARWRGAAGNLRYEVAGVVGQVEVDDGSRSRNTEVFGLTAAAELGFDVLRLGGQLGYYDGTARYLWQGAPDAFIRDNGSIETVSNVAAMLWGDLEIAPRTNLGLVFGWNETDSDAESAAAGVFEDTLYTIHANIRHRPVDRLTVGLEIQYGEREVFNGDDGDATRVQVATRFDF